MKQCIRLVKILILYFFLGFGLFVLITSYIALKKVPDHCDYIAVYTGETKRIDYALSIFKHTNSAKIIISGVQASVHKPFINNMLEKYSISHDKIILGKNAKNTDENAMELNTASYLLDFKGVCIVTATYHGIRSKLATTRYAQNVDSNIITIMPDKFKSLPGLIKLSALMLREYSASLLLLLDWSLDSILVSYDKYIQYLAREAARRLGI